jgi:SAM-dependent methyltransferase
MAQLYGPFYKNAWEQALLLPGFTDLLESLTSEVAAFYNISEEEARNRMVANWEQRDKIMLGTLPKNQTTEKLRDYYTDQEHGIYDSMYWHSLRPNRWALHSVAALFQLLQYTEGRRVFEFGHGVGSTGILLARHGFDVTLGDISRNYRAFSEYRLRLRGLEGRFMDLTQSDPEPNTYDAVVSLDVIEHIPKPMPEIKKLYDCLKPGGVMALNICFGHDPGNPEHVLYWRTGVLDRIRALGFERIPATLLVYHKRELSLFRKPLYRVQDFTAAIVEDVCARLPKLGRLFHIYCAPGLK